MTDNALNFDSDSQYQAELDQRSFSLKNSSMQKDGTLWISLGGWVGTRELDGTVMRMWDGCVIFKPDDADYQFWLWMLKRWPYRSSLAIPDLPTLKDEYVNAGSPTSGSPTSCAETDDGPEPGFMDWPCRATFSPKDAITQADGTIAIPVSGDAHNDEIWDKIQDSLRELGYCKLIRNDRGFWEGSLEIYPNHADYQFWQYLIQRWPRHSSLSAEDIPTLKAEHLKHKASEPRSELLQ